MEPKQEAWVLAGTCAVLALLSVAGLIWVFMSGMGLAVDTIFMVLVCASMAGLFSFALIKELQSIGLLPHWKLGSAKKIAEAPANPASEEKKE
jgi:hypothetical protein